MPLPSPVTENEMLDRLMAEVRRRYPRAKGMATTADYRTRNFYSPQWNLLGAISWWKVGGDLEPILAVMIRRGGPRHEAAFYFDPRGLHPADVVDLVKTHMEKYRAATKD